MLKLISLYCSLFFFTAKSLFCQVQAAKIIDKSDDYIAISWQNGIALEWGAKPSIGSQKIFSSSWLLSYQRTQSIAAVSSSGSQDYQSDGSYIFLRNSNALQNSLDYFGVHYNASWHFGNYIGVDFIDPFIALEAGPEGAFVGSAFDTWTVYGAAGFGIIGMPTDNLGIHLAFYYSGRIATHDGLSFIEGKPLDATSTQQILNQYNYSSTEYSQVYQVSHYGVKYNQTSNGFVTNAFFRIGVSLIY